MVSIGMLLLVLVAHAACGGSADEVGSPSRDAEGAADLAAVTGYSTLVMTVPSMTCPLCSRSIESRLKEAGLRDIRIDLETKLVRASFDPAEMTVDGVESLVEGTGFPVAESRLLDEPDGPPGDGGPEP